MPQKTAATEDTICAIATGLGDGAIGIVRLSGPEALLIADQVFRGKKKIAEMDTYTAAYGRLVHPGAVEQAVDEAVALVMRGPHTYTTEDTVELQCHGGAHGLREVLDLLMEQGARLAEPGEFTKRAFLGGRIDMSQAEAVMDVIRAENDAFYRAAQDQLGGLLRRKVEDLRGKLLTETARIEAALDDPEHYDLTGYGDELKKIITGVLQEVERLLSGSRQGIRLREGIPTVIAGLPNVGKSSVMNALLGMDRAIVTSEEGTTRDTLTETVQLGSLMLRLTDTAGIRETESSAEEAGIRRSYSSMEGAEIVLLVLDASRPVRTEEAELLRGLQKEKTLILLNKEDVAHSAGKENVKRTLMQLLGAEEERLPEILEISAKEGTGLTNLKRRLEERLLTEGFSGGRETLITSQRHREALLLTKESLGRVLEGIEAGMTEDFLTIDMLDGYAALGRITGETLEDDLADKIFAEFCMGK